MKYLILLFFISCASSNNDSNIDHLKNSRKLITQGHKSLYNNGAFKLPYSSVKFIPTGKEVFNISSQFKGMGSSAKISFVKAQEKAKESFYIIRDGSVKSYQISKSAGKTWKNISDKINKSTRKNSMWLIKRSSAAMIGLIKKGHKKSIELTETIIKDANDEPKKSLLASAEYSKQLEDEIDRYNSLMDKRISDNLDSRKSGSTINKGKNDFLLGYISLGDNLSNAYRELGSQKTYDEFKRDTKSSEKIRSKWSDYSLGLISDSVLNYTKSISNSFSNAQKEISSSDEYGITFALFSSLGWLLDGTLWQGLIKPSSKILVGGVGYVLTNGVVYPVMATTSGVKAGLDYAVEFTKFGMKSTYYVFAPSFKLAVASVIASGQVVIEQSSYGATKLMKPVGAGYLKTEKMIGSSIIQSSGHVKKSVTKYVVAPSVYIGGNVLSAGTGVVVGAVGTTTGLGIGATGEVINLTSSIVKGGIIGTGTLVGSSVSTVYGTSLMLYHASYSVVVPTGATLGSGVVLTYGMLSQIGAHSILALGDVSYVVLSLEGPKWVLYGIKGDVDKSDYDQGALINLNKLHKQGEEIRRVELTEEEAEKLIGK